MRHLNSTVGIPLITCPDRLKDPVTGKCAWSEKQAQQASVPSQETSQGTASEDSSKTGYIVAGVVVLAAAAGAFWWATKSKK